MASGVVVDNGKHSGKAHVALVAWETCVVRCTTSGVLRLIAAWSEITQRKHCSWGQKRDGAQVLSRKVLAILRPMLAGCVGGNLGHPSVRVGQPDQTAAT